MAPHPKYPGVDVRQRKRSDGTMGETFTVRWVEADGSKPRRTFDELQDALDFRAKRQADRRWRPEELRQERAGKVTVSDFFDDWWVTTAMVDLARSTLAVYRCLWEAHVEPRLGHLALREVDAKRVVRFRGETLAAGTGPSSVVKTMAMMQRVWRDAIEFGEAGSNPWKAVQKPSPGPTREAQPLTPLEVERVAHDLWSRGYEASTMLVRLMAYTGVRPQEALGLHWYAVREGTLLVEVANADGTLERLKNRKRSKKRSRTVDLLPPLRRDLEEWRRQQGGRRDDLVFPHASTGELWLDEHYRTWRRRIYVPSAENVGLPTPRPYDLRHTWASMRIAEKQLSIAEIAEQLGDKTSTVLDTYTHVLNEWRNRKGVNVTREIGRARERVWR